MHSVQYGQDVLNDPSRNHQQSKVPVIAIETEMVVEETSSGYCGAIVEATKQTVTLEDRHGLRRIFPLIQAGFLFEGRVVTLHLIGAQQKPSEPRLTASGSIALKDPPARVAQASRIYVEGVHDAELVERVWGEDLRIEGVVVEPLHGIDDLPTVVAEFRPAATRRLGVLVDHLVTGSKEQRIAQTSAHPHVLIAGHPYVDIWQAVKPTAVGIPAWPRIARGLDWKQGVCRELGVSNPADMWRRVLRSVRSYRDLEVPLLGAMEQLIDFVTDYPGP